MEIDCAGGEWAAGDPSEDCAAQLQGLPCKDQKGEMNSRVLVCHLMQPPVFFIYSVVISCIRYLVNIYDKNVGVSVICMYR